MAALGDPHLRFPSVLIAGTNGKGSTAALLEAMARAAGCSTGLFTSPALEEVEEQIRLDGEPVAPARLASLLDRVVEVAPEALGGDPGGAEPTPFEALTAAAFLAFAEAEVELAVVECGMGGARDATNVLEPEVSVLTSVGLEHRRFLGDTREAIAREKAGIFRPGRPAVVGRMVDLGSDPDDTARVSRAVAAEAEARGAALHPLQEEIEVGAAVYAPGVHPALTVRLRTPVRWDPFYELELELPGWHQAWNAAVAVRTAELLAERGWGWLDADAIRRGAASCRLPGRLEWLPGPRVLLDAAHNPQAVAALSTYLEGVEESAGSGGGSWDLLFGVLEDKDAEAMLAPLAARARRVVLTRPSDPRGRDPAKLVPLLPVLRSGVEAEVMPEPKAALERLLAGSKKDPKRTGEEPPLHVVCGSMVLVGEVRQHLGSPSSAP